jgi:antitoxin MazE
METKVKIQKWGNDLGINIPPVIANGLSLKEGLYVNIHDNGNRIIIEPSKPNVSYNLIDMLNEMTENNVHHCIETGKPTGNEIWY